MHFDCHWVCELKILIETETHRLQQIQTTPAHLSLFIVAIVGIKRWVAQRKNEHLRMLDMSTVKKSVFFLMNALLLFDFTSQFVRNVDFNFHFMFFFFNITCLDGLNLLLSTLVLFSVIKFKIFHFFFFVPSNWHGDNIASLNLELSIYCLHYFDVSIICYSLHNFVLFPHRN